MGITFLRFCSSAFGTMNNIKYSIDGCFTNVNYVIP